MALIDFVHKPSFFIQISDMIALNQKSLKHFNSIFNFILLAHNSNGSKLSFHISLSSVLLIPCSYLIPTGTGFASTSVKKEKQKSESERSEVCRICQRSIFIRRRIKTRQNSHFQQSKIVSNYYLFEITSNNTLKSNFLYYFSLQISQKKKC